MDIDPIHADASAGPGPEPRVLNPPFCRSCRGRNHCQSFVDEDAQRRHMSHPLHSVRTNAQSSYCCSRCSSLHGCAMQGTPRGN
jgi:hypothetical protein